MKDLNTKVVARGNAKAFHLPDPIVKVTGLELNDKYDLSFKTTKGKKVFTFTEVKEWNHEILQRHRRQHLLQR